MTTANRRRRGKSLHLDLQGMDDRPPLAALFLVQFDIKAGYTIAWKRAESRLELQDSVEFKSLPSGLHNVKEDLIYFMHGDDFAGVSAFVNRSTEQWERNALMLAVGALVPLEQGRLGRSWKHATDLKKIAQELVQDPSKTQALEDYWQAHQPTQGDVEEGQQESDSQKPRARRPSNASVGSRKRKSLTSSAIATPGAGLSAYHPARSVSTLIDTFGPLIYPLYKAALLRKRILIMAEAPVETACSFVYDLSIISNIPSAVSELIPLEPLPSRLQPLFSVGVHDIDELSKRSRVHDQDNLGYGWVACTTDDVLSMKTNLYDIIVKLPAAHTRQAQERVWPTVQTPEGQEIKATQRDSRRYRVLRQSQKRFYTLNQLTPNSNRSTSTDPAPETSDDEPNGNDDQDSLLHKQPTSSNDTEPFDDTPDETLIESLSWSALAYNSFIWWASAGEKRADLDEEAEHDASLFRNLDSYSDRPGSSQSRRMSSGTNPLTPGAMSNEGAGGGMIPEMAVIAYFHRFTSGIVERLAGVVESEGEGQEDGEGEGDVRAEGKERGVVSVGSEDMRRMGLDVWSEGDRRFVEEMVEFYWGRRAEVDGGRIECCGVRIV